MDLLDDYSSDECSACETSASIKNKTAECKPGCVTVLPSEKMPFDTFDRTVPHVRGCWAGHIFLSISDADPEGEWKKHAAQATKRFGVALEHVGWSGTIVSQSNLHLSLSRPFFLQTASIDSFRRELQLELLHVRALALEFDDDIILSNDEGTRTFFGWKVADNEYLRHIVQKIDSVMLKYQQQVYYSPPIFHVSVASVRGTLPDCRRHLKQHRASESSDALVYYARKVSCSFGTVNHLDLMLLP